VHLVAIVLVVVAIALVMGPAALHRRTEPKSISERFLQLSSRFLQWGMASLALAIVLDVYIVTDIITRSSAFALRPPAPSTGARPLDPSPLDIAPPCCSATVPPPPAHGPHSTMRLRRLR